MIFDIRDVLTRNALAAYAIALVASALAMAVNMVGAGLFGDRPFTSLYAAVVVSAYAGGLGPGLLATFVCVAGVSFFLLQPRSSFDIEANSDMATVILFVTASLFICWVLHSLRRTAQTLRVERDHSRDLSERLERTVHQKEILVREIQHRVANSLQLVSSFLMLQRRSVTNPDAKRDLEEASNRIHVLADIHRRLYAVGREERIEFAGYLKDFSRDLMKATAPHTVACAVDGDASVWLPQEKVIPLALIVNELVSNALEHGLAGRNDGKITIALEKREQDRVAVRISDNGCGLPPDFDLEAVRSVGLSIVRALSSQIDGALRLDRNVGTTWEVEFPH